MKFEDLIEKVCKDKRTYNIPILYVTQILMVITDLFRLEKKDEQHYDASNGSNDERGKSTDLYADIGTD